MTWEGFTAPVRRLVADDLARGSGVNLTFTVLNGVLGLLAAAVAARVLGPGGVGVVGIGLLLVEFASVIDNLPTAAFMREYAHRPERAQVATVLATKGAIGVGLTLLILLLSPVIAVVFDVPVIVPVVFAFIPVTSIVDSVAIMSWEARRDMVRRNAPLTVESFSRTALYALVAVAPVLPVTPVLAISLATLAASIAGTLAGLAFIPTLRLAGFSWSRAGSYASFGLRTATSGIMQKIIFWVDIAVIDLVLGHTDQGLYRSAYTLMSYMMLFAGTVGIMLYPTIAAAHGAGDAEGTRRALSLGFWYSLLLVVPVAVVLALAPEFWMTLVMGDAFAGAGWMLGALALVGVLGAALRPFEAFLPAVNEPGIFLRIVIAQVVVNVTLDVVLIPLIGVAGGIIATAVTFTVGLVASVAAVRRLGTPLPRFRDVVDVLAGRASLRP